MIAVSEIGHELLARSNDGYNVIVGSTVAKPILFTSYADHPRKLVKLSAVLSSTAAGRYQLLARFYDAYKKSLSLVDFSPPAQDAIALQQIKECGAIADVETGRIASAIAKCAHIWASLPGASYPGQHMNQLSDLQFAFVSAGGKVA